MFLYLDTFAASLFLSCLPWTRTDVASHGGIQGNHISATILETKENYKQYRFHHHFWVHKSTLLLFLTNRWGLPDHLKSSCLYTCQPTALLRCTEAKLRCPEIGCSHTFICLVAKGYSTIQCFPMHNSCSCIDCLNQISHGITNVVPSIEGQIQ